MQGQLYYLCCTLMRLININAITLYYFISINHFGNKREEGFFKQLTKIKTLSFIHSENGISSYILLSLRLSTSTFQSPFQCSTPHGLYSKTIVSELRECSLKERQKYKEKNTDTRRELHLCERKNNKGIRWNQIESIHPRVCLKQRFTSQFCIEIFY